LPVPKCASKPKARVNVSSMFSAGTRRRQSIPLCSLVTIFCRKELDLETQLIFANHTFLNLWALVHGESVGASRPSFSLMAFGSFPSHDPQSRAHGSNEVPIPANLEWHIELESSRIVAFSAVTMLLWTCHQLLKMERSSPIPLRCGGGQASGKSLRVLASLTDFPGANPVISTTCRVCGDSGRFGRPALRVDHPTTLRRVWPG